MLLVPAPRRLISLFLVSQHGTSRLRRMTAEVNDLFYFLVPEIVKWTIIVFLEESCSPPRRMLFAIEFVSEK